MRYLIFIANAVLAVLILFFQRKSARSTWAWLLLLFSFPVVGIVIYLLFGVGPEPDRSIPHEPELYQHNDIYYLTRGLDLFALLFDDIRQAKKSIDLEYYIIRKDFLTYEMMSILKQKAREGVTIRILYDGMGCMGYNPWKKGIGVWFDELRHCGISVTDFFSPTLRNLRLRLNYRNHRKIVVIDNEIGYLGGFNIGKEYLGLNKKLGPWRDTHLRIKGEAVTGLAMQFEKDYQYAISKRNKSQAVEMPVCSLPQDVAEYRYHFTEKPGAMIHLVVGGPNQSVQSIRNHFFRLIVGAKHCLDIQTPYFIPDESILCALFCAAEHGVRIRIMVPCKPDHPMVYRATLSYLGDLLAVGVECYLYQDGFLHAKGVIADHKILSYGTANMDVRSFLLNYEMNAVIYGREEAARMTRQFEKDLEHSVQLTKEDFESRNMLEIVRECLSRLLSPIL